MFNVQQITSRLASMSDAQLAQYARIHKDDPYVLPLASSEFKRRQQLRQSGQTQQGGPKPTVADQEIAMMDQDALPEDQGIGVLPAQNIATMADGGIAGYAEGGTVNMAGGTKDGGKFNPDAYMQDPNVQKFLNYLNVYEGKPQANHLVGFKTFEGFDKHPHKPVVFNKKGATSDAAGLFQIKGDTWEYQKKKLGLTDFAPDNQKRAAIGILKDIGALSDIVQGNFEAAKKKATRQWASIPGSTIGKATGQIPRYKEEAEKLLDQPGTQQAQNQRKQDAPKPDAKERTLGQRLFDVLPFSKAGAAENSKRKPFSAIPPIDEDFYTRLEAAREDYQKLYGKELPVTSLGRTRYEQQGLSNKKQRGSPGSEKIFTPVNPAEYPGREVFHMNAADVSSYVPEAFMRKHGLYRPDPKGDPVHYVAIKDWKPEGDTRTAAAKPAATTPPPAPAVVSNQAVPSAVVPAQRRDTTPPPPVVQQTRTAPPKPDAGLPSLISSANATDVVPAQRRDVPAQTQVVPQVRTSPAPRQIPFVPPPYVDASGTSYDVFGNPLKPAPVPVQTAPAPAVATNTSPAPRPAAATTVANAQAPAPADKRGIAAVKPKDDVVYDPNTGLPIFGGVAYGKGENDPYTSENQALALGTGTADVILGIPEALANLAMRNIYNLPVGKEYTWEEASKAAGEHPLVKAVGRLRSGSWFGLENDPAYRKDPINAVLSLIPLGVQGIAKKLGINEEAAQLVFDDATVMYPFLRRAKNGSWQVKDNMPKLEGSKPRTQADLDLALKAAEDARAEADAANQQIANPRLPAPAPSIKVTPEGEATLPGTTTPRDRSGIQLLADDTQTAKNKEARAAKAEETAAATKAAVEKAEAAKARNAKALETYGIITGLTPFPRVTPKRVLSAGTDFSTTPPFENQNKPSLPITDWWEYGSDPTKRKPDSITEAKKVAEQVTAPSEAPVAPKASGFSNEDILTMGLNMMMAQPGQPGGAFSQLASNVGRSGLATLQGRREREKLAQEQTYKDLYSKYIQKQTDVMGQEPPEIRTIRAFQKEPELLETQREMYENRTSPAMLLKTYEDTRTKAEATLNDAWLSKNPDFQTWLRNSGYGGAAISPNVLEKMNLYK